MAKKKWKRLFLKQHSHQGRIEVLESSEGEVAFKSDSRGGIEFVLPRSHWEVRHSGYAADVTRTLRIRMLFLFNGHDGVSSPTHLHVILLSDTSKSPRPSSSIWGSEWTR